MNASIQRQKELLRDGLLTALLKLNSGTIYLVLCNSRDIYIYITCTYLGPLYPSIDESLVQYNDLVKTEFSKRWSKHKCNVPGCQTVLVFDGGCKVLGINRI